MTLISQGNDFCEIPVGKCTSGRKATCTNRCKKFEFLIFVEHPLYKISEYVLKQENFSLK